MNKKSRVLVIDDDPSTIRFVKRILLQEKFYQVTTAAGSQEALDILESSEYSFDIAIIDQKLPDIMGIDLLKMIKDRYSRTECVMLTAIDDVEVAVKAIKIGAYDFLRKPVEPSKLVVTLRHILEKGDLLSRIENLRDKSEDFGHKEAFRPIVTRSLKMFDLFHQVEMMASTDDPILICGESGTGKELFARSIHEIRFENQKLFSAVNISSYQNELLSNELFGHVKGAYTGAQTESEGIIGVTNDGTLFLDEIGDLDLSVQSRLLRVLENKEYYRIGDTRVKKVRCRFIFATNKDLFQLMERGLFRKDLYFRISAHIVSIPPLRERREDIDILAGTFLQRFAEKSRKKIKGIHPEVRELLNRYNFPGNVRELENIIKSSSAIETAHQITKKSLPKYFLNYFFEDSRQDLVSLQEMERRHIRTILEAVNKNKSHAAKILGISRPTLIKKLKEYGNSV
ncbi:MAG: sigma-54-dependent Fis family transcriptional regulator [Candidatus Aureabacteria bacterium]|nr:sigma-54-dependent Fis family transcriptional regulator [Candidatus Auribacterota bacterium]